MMPTPPSSLSLARRPAPAWLGAAAALALAACSTAPQQQPAAPQPAGATAAPAPPAQAPQQGAQAAPNPALQALLARSDGVLQLIDANRGDELWAATAPFIQTAMQRAQLLDGVHRARTALGPVQGRGRAGVQPLQFGAESKMPPPGQYANVLYVAQLANGQRAIERLSFRQDGGNWLFTGYTTQPLVQQAAPAPAASTQKPPTASPAAPRR